MSRTADTQAPSHPTRMPHDADQYAASYSLTHFINAFYQIRDCLRYSPRRALVVGVGVGLEPILLREKFGVDVTTLDIDPGFRPDYIGSVHDMPMFSEGQFDVCIASHVLEHLAFDSYFEKAVREISRVANHAVIYLPYAGRHLEWKFSYAQGVREYSLQLTIPPMNTITGDTPDLQHGEHYWECGYRHFGVASIAQIIARHFLIDECYHNLDWKYSLNFNLTSHRSRCTA